MSNGSGYFATGDYGVKAPDMSVQNEIKRLESALTAATGPDGAMALEIRRLEGALAAATAEAAALRAENERVKEERNSIGVRIRSEWMAKANAADKERAAATAEAAALSDRLHAALGGLEDPRIKQLTAERDKDYAGMREMQAKFMAADHALRDMTAERDALVVSSKCVEALEIAAHLSKDIRDESAVQWVKRVLAERDAARKAVGNHQPELCEQMQSEHAAFRKALAEIYYGASASSGVRNHRTRSAIAVIANCALTAWRDNWRNRNEASAIRAMAGGAK